MSGHTGRRIRRIVLVGFMGSGKSAVGAMLAEHLGWRHIDLDEEIERGAGRSVAEILRTDGEPAFRRLERAATTIHAEMGEVVISTGGGWAAQPGLLDGVGADTLSVWLRVAPEEVRRRVGADPGRPLLPPEPEALARMLSERERWYDRAALTVETDGRTVDSIAREIARTIREIAEYTPRE